MATTIRQHMITCGGACSVVAEINQLLVTFLKHTPALHSDDYFISYLIFVIFFTQAKFLENKIYTEKTRTLRQNTQKIAIFLRYYAKIHSKLPIFRVKSVKIYTGQKNLH